MRFPGFDGEWEVNTLGEITEKIGDGLHGTPNYIEDSNFYFINGNNLVNGKIELNDNTKKIDLETFSKNEKGLNENTLLISINGTIGSIAKYNQEKVMLGKSVGYFNFSNSSDFFYFALQTNSVQDFFISELTGSTIKNLSLKTLRETAVYFPSANEQQKIANFLSLIDERIQTQSKIIQQLESLMQCLRDKFFKQQIKFKDENGHNFPNWEDKKLGEVLIKNSNKNKGQKHSLVQSVSNKHGFINQEEMFADRRIASKETSNYYVIEKGHFAYNPSRIDVGSLAYKANDEISIISPLYISFSTNKKFLKDNYLLNWFSSEQFTKQMDRSFEGSVRNTLSYESLTTIRIHIPCLKEQVLISNYLTLIKEKMEIERRILQQLENQKKYLLSNLFI